MLALAVRSDVNLFRRPSFAGINAKTVFTAPRSTNRIVQVMLRPIQMWAHNTSTVDHRHKVVTLYSRAFTPLLPSEQNPGSDSLFKVYLLVQWSPGLLFETGVVGEAAL
jgi:hypothetical protein